MSPVAGTYLALAGVRRERPPDVPEGGGAGHGLPGIALSALNQLLPGQARPEKKIRENIMNVMRYLLLGPTSKRLTCLNS